MEGVLSLLAVHSLSSPDAKGARDDLVGTPADIVTKVGDWLLRHMADDSEMAKAIRLTSRLLRKRSCLRAVRARRDESWMKEVVMCQEEIASRDTHKYYTENYKDEEISFWFHIPKWIREDAARRPIKKCLDIGPAHGTLALFCKRLLDCDVYCTDIVDGYLSRALLSRTGVFFSVGNIEVDPLPWNEKFDVIIFTEILEHLNFNPIPTLSKIAGLLSDTGRMYMSTPDAWQWGRITKHYSRWREMPPPEKRAARMGGHIYQFSKDELFDVVHQAGLEVERFDYSPGVGARHFNLSLIRKL